MPIDFSNAWNTGVKIINETISLLPNLLLAVLIFFAFLLISAGGKSLARRWVQRQRNHQGIALLMARLVQTSILVLGFLIALSVVAPSFKAGDLVKLLGFSEYPLELSRWDPAAFAGSVSTRGLYQRHGHRRNSL